MAAELGIVGLIAFAMLVGGVAAAAAQALRRSPGAAAGACAATLVWLLHASFDWDWQLPAVSLPAVVLAGALIVLAEARPLSARKLTGSSRRSTASARRDVPGSVPVADSCSTLHAVKLSGSRRTTCSSSSIASCTRPDAR